MPIHRERTMVVAGFTAGLDIPVSRHFSVGYKLSAVRFAGDTDLRAMLGLRLNVEDWDGPPG